MFCCILNWIHSSSQWCSTMECGVVNKIWRCSPISFRHVSIWCFSLILTKLHTLIKYRGLIKKRNWIAPIYLSTKPITWVVGTHLCLASGVGSILHQTMLVVLTCGPPNPLWGLIGQLVILKGVGTEGLGELSKGGTIKLTVRDVVGEFKVDSPILSAIGKS